MFWKEWILMFFKCDGNHVYFKLLAMLVAFVGVERQNINSVKQFK